MNCQYYIDISAESYEEIRTILVETGFSNCIRKIEGDIEGGEELILPDSKMALRRNSDMDLRCYLVYKSKILKGDKNEGK